MEIEMEMNDSRRDKPSSEPKQSLNRQNQYQEVNYRWVVVSLTSLALMLNGIANNAIAPLELKMTKIYGVSEQRVSLSIILSFLIFFIANFPANKIIDKHGLRVSLCLGTAFYFLGTFFYLLINVNYNFTILGTLLIGLGQPFLLNSSAKVAAFWFFPNNRAFATSLMVGSNLIGVGFGFLIPTLVVQQQSDGQEARNEIKFLYLSYFIFAGVCLILSLLFMQASPQISPSEGANATKLSSFSQSFSQIKKDRNFLKFILSYCVHYGTFIALTINSNFIIKPYGYTDIEIAVNVVLMLILGSVGSIVFSLYLKRTSNYLLVLRSIMTGASLMMIILCLWLNTVNQKVGTLIIMCFMGFIGTPQMPICYEFGCELTFPMGQATITGLLNGGALLWTFLASSFVSSVFGYGNITSSLVTMITLSAFVVLAALSFMFVKSDLKRKRYEDLQKKKETDYNTTDYTYGEEQINRKKQNAQMSLTSSPENPKYLQLIQEVAQNKENKYYL